ncbi:hypothetical protein BTW08_16630, partial [Salinicola sp. MH3R3-1]
MGAWTLARLASAFQQPFEGRLLLAKACLEWLACFLQLRSALRVGLRCLGELAVLALLLDELLALVLEIGGQLAGLVQLRLGFPIVESGLFVGLPGASELRLECLALPIAILGLATLPGQRLAMPGKCTF